MHLPHDGNALSHRFFFLRQLRQTLEDLAAVVDSAGDVASDESLSADMVRNRPRENSNRQHDDTACIQEGDVRMKKWT